MERAQAPGVGQRWEAKATKDARRGLAARVTSGVSAAVGALSGLAPHLLHHVGPIAGAALITGAAGSMLFGALGLLLMIPLLLRLRRRFGSWLAPGIALALFVAMFMVSTLWIGPAIRGDAGADDAPDPHDHGESYIRPFEWSLPRPL